jgi:hypothetical protein
LVSATATPGFFVPGTPPESREAEHRYEQLRKAAHTVDGAGPCGKRIYSLSCRYAGRDCVIEVGSPNPVDGGEVLAIFELNSRGGYSIATAAGTADLHLGRHVYWVTEFA